MNKRKKADLLELNWTIDWLKGASGTDYDLADAMNLLYRIRGPEMAYPLISSEHDSSKVQFKAISISDSFYWTLYSYHIGDIFEKHQFWYYFNEIWPRSVNCESDPKMVSEIDLRSQIDSNNLFIIVNSEGSIGNYGFGFIEAAYNLYFPVIK